VPKPPYFVVADLLPGAKALLSEALEGLDPDSPNLPELRMGKAGRNGCRYWLYGKQRKVFNQRRPASEFEELRNAGFLRRLRTDKSTGTYFAFTAAAFRERDGLAGAQTNAAGPPVHERPASPAAELNDSATRLETLRGLAEEAKEALAALMEVSEAVKTVDNDPSSGVVFIPMHPWRWLDLAPEHRPLLGAAKEATDTLLSACKATLGVGGPEHLEEFEDLSDSLRRMYVRGSNSAGPRSESPSKNNELAAEAIAGVLRLIDSLPSAHEDGDLILVPDTNALIQDPELENWQTGPLPCTIVIVSQVQSELDRKKASDSKVAIKATSLIKRFKEYSRRGDTLSGVPLAGTRRFKEVPIRADMNHVPSWLDGTDPDDRILAATLELASKHLGSRVVLVTRDRGLQNKARSVQCPAVDVADL
jgi:hypothetical protein